jgi:hypothetical protein
VPGTMPADPFILSDAAAAVKRRGEDSQKFLFGSLELAFCSVWQKSQVEAAIEPSKPLRQL